MGEPQDTLRCAVEIGVEAQDKAAAIAAAARLLAASGCADPAYGASMAKRETLSGTCLGGGIAIPHGLGRDRALIREDGIAVLRLAAPIVWTESETVQLVVGIAARSDTHLAILRRLTRLMQDRARLDALLAGDDAEALRLALTADATIEANIGTGAAAEDLPERVTWRIDYPSGLHARPARLWVEAASAASVRLRVRHGSQSADPRNLLALLQLGLKQGDEVVLSAAGLEARRELGRFHAALAALTAGERAEQAECASTEPRHGWAAEAKPTLAGVGASPGLAIGTIRRLERSAAIIADEPVTPVAAAGLLAEAIACARAGLADLARDTAARLGTERAAIFAAQADLLDDTDLITETCRRVVAGHGLVWSWHEASETAALRLEQAGSALLAARAADIRDVARRVLVALDPSLDDAPLGPSAAAGPFVVTADDIAPSHMALLDLTSVVGFVTARGGPTSHSAILARASGLPAIVAAGDAALALRDGAPILIDGDSGRVWLDPGERDRMSAQAAIAAAAQAREAEARERAAPGATADGHAIAIEANIDRADQAALALDQGAEGVGLMRTEVQFLERDHAPDEDEQHGLCMAMLAALGAAPLTVRALDIGGDKQVPHLALPREDNPFLGVRGARLLLRRPDLLDPQLRALYRAARDDGADRLSILFPMVTTLAEWLALRERAEAIRLALMAPRVPLGVMIEVPAAALLAADFAAHADFFSIGTNDLTQYALAMDRQNAALAASADAFHPAVLRLIAMTVEGASAHRRPVAVCGAMAGDPSGAALLVGLGVDALSMAPRDIPAVKARLRRSGLAALQDLARHALTLDSAAKVRAAARAEGAR